MTVWLKIRDTVAKSPCICGCGAEIYTRSKGVGKALLEYAKSRKPSLTVSVYQKNQRALAFYRRKQFVVQSEGIDEDTNEADIQMLWTRQA